MKPRTVRSLSSWVPATLRSPLFRRSAMPMSTASKKSTSSSRMPTRLAELFFWRHSGQQEHDWHPSGGASMRPRQHLIVMAQFGRCEHLLLEALLSLPDIPRLDGPTSRYSKQVTPTSFGQARVHLFHLGPKFRFSLLGHIDVVSVPLTGNFETSIWLELHVALPTRAFSTNTFSVPGDMGIKLPRGRLRIAPTDRGPGCRPDGRPTARR